MSSHETERFSRYDTADYLKSEEDIAAYLDAVMEDGDPALIAAPSRMWREHAGCSISPLRERWPATAKDLPHPAGHRSSGFANRDQRL